MVKNNKLVFGIALLLALVGCGQQTNINGISTFHEEARDLLTNNETGVRFQAGELGEGGEIQHSTIYTQYGIDSDNNYCLRFATALKGNITSISYERKAFGDKEANTSNVNVVYKSIMANGVATYYDGASLSETAGEENYYWACYTICYKSEDAKTLYDEQVAVTLKVNEETIGTKSISLNEVINPGIEKSYYFQGENLLNNPNTSTKLAAQSMGRTFLGKLNDNDGVDVELIIESDKAAKATLFACINEREAPMKFTDSLAMKLNGETLECDTVIPASDHNAAFWYSFKEFEIVDFNLKEGTNTFIFTTGAQVFSIDYFKVVTKAAISNSDDNICTYLCPTCEKCLDLNCVYHDEKCKSGKNTYRFEAEDASLTKGTKNISKESDGSYLGTISGNKGCKVTFTFTADKASKGTLTAALTTMNNMTNPFSSFLTVNANGTEMDTSNVYFYSRYSRPWHAFSDMILGCIDIVEGENTIEFSTPSTIGLNFDYIYIDTDSVINNNESTHSHNCATCGKCVDPNCRASQCADKCQDNIEGTKQVFTPSDAVTNGVTISNGVMSGLSKDNNSTISYTLDLTEDSIVGMYIEFSMLQRRTFIDYQLDMTIDGNPYATSARNLGSDTGKAIATLFIDYYLGCVALDAGSHTITFTITTTSATYLPNVRNFTAII